MKALIAIVTAAIAAGVFAQDASDASSAKAERRQRAPHSQVGGMRGGMRSMMDPIMADPVCRAIWHMSPRIAESIGLTAEQKQKLMSLNIAKRSRDLESKVQKGVERQVELLKAEKPDVDAIMAAIDEIFDARKAMAKEQTKTILEARSVLTPEQIAKIMQMVKDFRGGHGRKPGAGAGKPKKPAPANE